MTRYWDEYPEIKSDLETVHSVIVSSLESGNTKLDAALRDLADRGGKMLRPAFVLLAARARIGPTELPKKMYALAAAVEMLHMATLVHDDIIDDAATRRGAPTLHTLHGRKNAVLMGDYLFARCFSIVSAHATVENAQLLARGVEKICTAEISQNDADEPVTPRRYYHRIIGKTALLFALSFYVGARENGVRPVVSNRLRRIGYNIGMGFQIRDDILDFLGDEGKTGKPRGSDLRQGIRTLPFILAASANGIGSTLDSIMSSAELRDSDVETITRLVEKAGGFSRAQQRVELYTTRAMRETLKLPRGHARERIIAVTERLLTRIA